MRAYRRNAAIAISFFAFFSTAHGQNQVQNPDFDTDTSNWAADNGAMIAFEPTQTIVGAPGSGAIRVQNFVANGYSSGALQCIPGPFPSGDYDFGAWILFPEGQLGSGGVRVGVGTYGNIGCTALLSYQYTSMLVQQQNSWLLSTATTTLDQPAQSILLTLEISTPPGSSNAVFAYFDGVRFGAAPTLPVELQSFEVE